MHHLCLISANDACNKIMAAADPSYVSVPDEECKILCAACFELHYTRVGVTVSELAEQLGANVSVAVSSSAVVSHAVASHANRPGVRGEDDNGDSSHPAESSADLEAAHREGIIEHMMNQQPSTIDDAVQLFERSTQRQLEIEEVAPGEEFTVEELRFLCAVGACFETKYKSERRSSLVSTCTVSAFGGFR